MSNHDVLQAVLDMREELWSILDRLDDAVEIYPGWKKREFLTHIAGWEAMVFDYLRCHLTHKTPLDHAYTTIDEMNARFVKVRQGMTIQDAKIECEINRFAILQLLEQIDDFNEVIQLPWGKNTVKEFIDGAIEHEKSHGADIMHLDQWNK